MLESRQRLLRRKIFTWLKSKYRLIIMNNDTYEEKFSLSLSPLNVFTIGGTILIVFTVLVISFVAFTPLREFIPGYADVNLRRRALYAVAKADSLEHELAVKNRYIQNFNNIISGKIGADSVDRATDTVSAYGAITLKKSKEDSLLRAQIESSDKYNLTFTEDRPRKSLSAYVFFPPINGAVSNSFQAKENHYGVDVVAPENEAVKATLDGTVIFSSWTTENGHVIQLQHENNIISSYKHNSVLLKKAGDYVKAGEVIAIVGNSGELSTGPHLHFELWYNGIPLNPQEYIVF